MPAGTEHHSRNITKLLNIGPPGSGKTGALACLAEAGYRLVILDFDNGIDILINVVRKHKPEALSNIIYEVCTDKMKMVPGMAGGKIVTEGPPTAWVKAITGLSRWKFPIAAGSKETYDLGPASSWGPETILVLDSLGLAGEAAMRFVVQLNAHQFLDYKDRADYGQAMDRLETLLQLLFSDGIGCNVIVNTHITYVEDRMNKSLQGMPRALGSALPPKVGGYFNTIVRSTTKEGSKRVILTRVDMAVELKLPLLPDALPSELPIETGLLTLFQALQVGGVDPITGRSAEPTAATGRTK